MKSSRESERNFGRKRLSVFVDANTIVSGLIFEGNEALLLKLGATGACKLVTTHHVIDEVSRVLSAREFNLTQDEIASLLGFVNKALAVHEALKPRELELYRLRLDDKKDTQVLAAFEKSKCDILVTGDKELLRKVSLARTTRQALKILLDKS